MAVVLALASALTWGAADFLGGLASKRSQAVAVAGFSQLAGGLVLVATLPLFDDPLADPSDLVRGAIAGLFGAMALTTFYGALARGQMSVVAPMTAVISAVVPVAAGLGFGERPAVLALTGVLLALPAVGLVSTGVMSSAPVDVEPRFLEHPLRAAVLAGIGFGMFFVVLEGTAETAGVWPLVAARAASVPILLGYGAARARHRLDPASMWTVIGAGILDMIANVFYLFAVRRGLLSVVAVLAALYPVSTVVLARVVLSERITRTQAVGLVGAALAVALVVSA